MCGESSASPPNPDICTSNPSAATFSWCHFLRGQSVGIDKISLPSLRKTRIRRQRRRAAIAYADELAKKHGAEIIKAGGWKEKAA